MKHIFTIFTLIFLVSACAPVPVPPANPGSDPASVQEVPAFDHIVIITMENSSYQKVIGNPYMPTFNMYARDYTLLTQFYGVTHPSLPNYLAMIGGDTFDIVSDCENCFVQAPSLPDLIETSGRTWKTYQEDMQVPCGLGHQDEDEYAQKHNPFVYFDAIRLDTERCDRSVVPLRTLRADIKAGTLPDFIFITPNMCNDAHDCKLIAADAWLTKYMRLLMPALEKDGSKYLIVLTWDEAVKDPGSCCGLPKPGGGHIATVLISPWVKNHFQDATPYSHYSLLKTIAASWDLAYLGHAADKNTSLILAPWKSSTSGETAP